jgi:hypothetical protein
MAKGACERVLGFFYASTGNGSMLVRMLVSWSRRRRAEEGRDIDNEEADERLEGCFVKTSLIHTRLQEVYANHEVLAQPSLCPRAFKFKESSEICFW